MIVRFSRNLEPASDGNLSLFLIGKREITQTGFSVWIWFNFGQLKYIAHALSASVLQTKKTKKGEMLKMLRESYDW